MKQSVKVGLVVCAACVVSMSSLVFAQTAELEKAEKKAPAAQQPRPKEIKMDRNNDGIIDRIEMYDSDGNVVKIAVDNNGKGKMNEWAYYEKGRIIKTEKDNGKGKIDEWVIYEDGKPVKAEKDINGDGKPDVHTYYDEKGLIIKSEGDSTGKGKVDEWVYYESGKPVKAEKDTNGDGKPDTWVTY